ncbi:MAG: hypothetical protein ACJ77B_03395 [Chloroflexota bacterium]
MTRGLPQIVTGVIAAELIVTPFVAAGWKGCEPLSLLNYRGFMLQPWLPPLAIAFAGTTLALLVVWLRSMLPNRRRAPIGLGLVVAAMLGFGLYAFHEFYWDLPPTTGFRAPTCVAVMVAR